MFFCLFGFRLLEVEWKEKEKRELVMIVKVPRRNSGATTGPNRDPMPPPAPSGPIPSCSPQLLRATSLVINSSTDVDRKMLP